jgi:tetratricopeptide (TPR) repeat protein
MERDVRSEEKQIPRFEKSGRGRAVLFLVVLAWLIPCPAFAKPAANAAEAQKVRAEKYEIEVRFEPEKSFLRAKATVTLRVEQKTETIELELNPRLNILEVTDAQERKLEFRRSGLLGSAKLQVWLAEAAAADQEIKLTFVYEGTLLRGALDYITKDGILLRDDSRWYPALDLSGMAQNDIRFDLPPGWSSITAGELMEHQEAKTRDISRWETRRPVSSRAVAGVSPELSKCNVIPGGPVHRMASWPGFVYGCFASEQWKAGCCAHPFISKIDSILKERTWPLVPETSPSGLAAEALRELASPSNVAWSSLSPLRDFVIVQGFPGQQGVIGYSGPGFLVVSEDVIKYNGYPGWAPEFLPHEIAHQWFPIEVTLARPEDAWLAESLAEYLAWRYLNENDPEQARRMVQRALRDALATEPLPPLALGLRLFREPWEVTRATLYQRGLMVWRTLETVIDRERVDRALREYYKRFAGKSASIADFRKICEEISGRDLAWFFEYFINGTQIPEISLRRLPSDAPNVLLGEIVLKNVPADFQVRVAMRVQTAKGAVEHSVATRGEVTPFSVNLPAAATQVTLDPDMRLLRWTEAARRNREQAQLFGQMSELEDGGEFGRAIELCKRAIDLDPDDRAANHQQIRFVMGRMLYRAGKLGNAKQELGRVLEQSSLDPMETDFYRAWAHVYRARIAKRRGWVAEAAKEANAGLASKSPAMETKITWPEAPSREMSARAALRAILRP